MAKELTMEYKNKKIVVKLDNLEDSRKNKKYIKNFLSIFLEKYMEAMLGKNSASALLQSLIDCGLCARAQDGLKYIGIRFQELIDKGLCFDKEEARESVEHGFHVLAEIPIIVEKFETGTVILDKHLFYEIYTTGEEALISYAIDGPDDLDGLSMITDELLGE